MRLIDKDALNKTLQERVGSPIDDKLYEVNLCIIDAPTVDAIPVEWLLGKALDAERAIYYCKGDAKRNADILFAVRVVLELWKEDGA